MKSFHIENMNYIEHNQKFNLKMSVQKWFLSYNYLFIALFLLCAEIRPRLVVCFFVRFTREEPTCYLQRERIF